MRLRYPGQKKFAFTIFDDTDFATVENVKPVYDLLYELNIITTKSVWVFKSSDPASHFRSSQTLEDPDYLSFVCDLQEKGFEIAFHGATMSSSVREVTIAALDRFKELFGSYPKMHVNHASNKDNLYWGKVRLDLTLLRLLISLKRDASEFEGHEQESPFFWGDICQKYITYGRNFVFREINLMRVNPTMPYKDPNRPFIPYWFSSSEGASAESFNRLLAPLNQEKLEKEGGVCIVYTHLANGFVKDGEVNPETRQLLTELSRRDGWFVPVSTLLDYLRTQQLRETLSPCERARMELMWFLTKVRHGTS